MICAEGYKGSVLLEELRQVEILTALVRLLIKIYGSYAILKILNVGRYIHHKIIRAHIAQQPDETTLVEFDEFLGKTNAVRDRLLQIFGNEYISRNAGNMLFHQGVVMGEKSDPVGRKQVLQFQSVY